MLMQSGIKQLADATGEALRSIRTSSGKTTDPDLMKYETLSDDDFMNMEREFGAEGVFSYIREMELKRLAEKQRR